MTAGRACLARQRRGAAQLIAAALALFGSGLLGCTTSRLATTTEDTTIEQILLTEAVDRAIEGLTWPELRGERVFLDIDPVETEEDTIDEHWYARQAIKAELAQRGAIRVDDRKDARYGVLVMIGALGTEERIQFFGLPPINSVVIPFSLPEIALYKVVRQQGFAKIEVVVIDVRQGFVVHRSGPSRAETFWRLRQVPLSSSITTDTSRYLVDSASGP